MRTRCFLVGRVHGSGWVLFGVLSPRFTVLQVALHVLSLYVSPQILGLPAPSATFIHMHFFFAHKETHVQVIT